MAIEVWGAIAARQSAIKRLVMTEYKAKLSEYIGDHKRHVEEGYPEHVQTLLRQGLADVRCHKVWLEAPIAKL